MRSCARSLWMDRTQPAWEKEALWMYWGGGGCARTESYKQAVCIHRVYGSATTGTPVAYTEPTGAQRLAQLSHAQSIRERNDWHASRAQNGTNTSVVFSLTAVLSRPDCPITHLIHASSLRACSAMRTADGMSAAAGVDPVSGGGGGSGAVTAPVRPRSPPPPSSLRVETSAAVAVDAAAPETMMLPDARRPLLPRDGAPPPPALGTPLDA